jgi:hypothetical protein
MRNRRAPIGCESLKSNRVPPLDAAMNLPEIETATKPSKVRNRWISKRLEVIEKDGRGEWIRTTDLLVPNSDVWRPLFSRLSIINSLEGGRGSSGRCGKHETILVATPVATR